MNIFKEPGDTDGALQIKKREAYQELKELQEDLAEMIGEPSEESGFKKWITNFFAFFAGSKYKEDEKDSEGVADVEDEKAYLISEHLREGCTSCPFCYDRGLKFGVVDETKIGRLLQQVTCGDCGETWTVEYEASRVRYKNKWYNRFEYWPTFLQVNSPDYKKMIRARYKIGRLPER